MSAQTPGAYGISVLIHGLAAGLALLFGYASNHVGEETPKVFELVAGEGDNYRATEAPALGSPGGVTLQSPPVVKEEAPQPVQPQPAPPQPEEASPIQAAPEAPPVAKPKAPPASKSGPQKPVDLVKELNRVQTRRKLNLERKYQKEMAAERKKEELRRAQEARASARAQRIDVDGIRNGVLGGSLANKEGGAGGKALTASEMNELDAYFAELKLKIKENHAPPEGVSDSLSAQVEFMVAADGSISRLRIISSSGNHAFDESVIEACEHTRTIGPRPDGQSDTVKMTFRMHEDESP
jgi:colicin import membrane protein